MYNKPPELVVDPGFPIQGAPTYYLTIFCQKLYENERNRTKRERYGIAPPFNKPMRTYLFKDHSLLEPHQGLLFMRRS